MGELFNFLAPVFVLSVIAWGTIMFLKILTDYFLKKMLIEAGSLNEAALNIFKDNLPKLSRSSALSGTFSPLKWGLVFLCGGIGLIILEFLEYSYYSPLPYGVIAVSVSIGFLIYYFIVKSSEKNV